MIGFEMSIPDLRRGRFGNRSRRMIRRKSLLSNAELSKLEAGIPAHRHSSFGQDSVSRSLS